MTTADIPIPARVGFYSDARTWGGAEIAVATLLSGLPDSIDPVVIGVDDEITRRLIAAAPRASAVVLRRPSGLRDLRSIVEHRRALARLELDILQLTSPSLYAAPAGLLAASMVPRLKLVIVEHSGIHPDSVHARIVKRLLSGMADAHVAVGSAVAKVAESWIGLPLGTLRPIQNAVVDQGPTTRPIDRSEPAVVGTLARLEHLKGIDVLVRAAPLVPDARFRIAGDGPDRDALRKTAECLGVADRFDFLGWADPAALLTSVDIFVLPSLSEGLPLSVLEAMMRGLPVVVTDVGSVAEAVVHGETGLLVAPGDSSSLATALVQLVNDPALRRRMGAAGRERALAGFSAERMVQDYVVLYEELLAQSAPTGGQRRSPSRAG